MRFLLPLLLCLPRLPATDYRTPAGTAPARRTETGKDTVLPGGRLLSPYGAQYTTGPGPFGLAIASLPQMEDRIDSR